MATAASDSRAATEALIAKFQVAKLLKQGTPRIVFFPANIEISANIHMFQTSKAVELPYWVQLMVNKEF